ITEKLHFYVQFEDSDVEQTSFQFTRPDEFDLRDDLGFAINYRFNPNVVLKAEYHEVDELLPSFAPVGVLPGGRPLLEPITFDAPDGSYSILSLAVSF
ncbi:MAG: hypothetical protein AAF725_05780, partial [Acidobacteriota bacterium]